MMSPFLEKSISHVHRLFPSIYNSRPKKGSFHFALGLERSKIVAVGLNRNDKVNAKALEFARKLGLTHKLKFPYLHSEEDLIGKLIGMDRLSPSLKIVVLRLNRFGVLGESKPCPSCTEVLKAYSLNRVWYSTSNGGIIQL